MAKSELISVRLTPELKQRLQEAAARDNRNLNNYIVTVLLRELEKEEQ